jgi:hypothetical protein
MNALNALHDGYGFYSIVQLVRSNQMTFGNGSHSKEY